MKLSSEIFQRQDLRSTLISWPVKQTTTHVLAYYAIPLASCVKFLRSIYTYDLSVQNVAVTAIWKDMKIPIEIELRVLDTNAGK